MATHHAGPRRATNTRAERPRACAPRSPYGGTTRRTTRLLTFRMARVNLCCLQPSSLWLTHWGHPRKLTKGSAACRSLERPGLDPRSQVWSWVPGRAAPALGLLLTEEAAATPWGLGAGKLPEAQTPSHPATQYP